jgi:hypothetical protein
MVSGGCKEKVVAVAVVRRRAGLTTFLKAEKGKSGVV